MNKSNGHEIAHAFFSEKPKPLEHQEGFGNLTKLDIGKHGKCLIKLNIAQGGSDRKTLQNERSREHKT